VLEQRRAKARSESPRPSSRETATPPHWVSGREELAINRLCEETSQGASSC
jgi:hypothetical protein